MNLSGVVWIGPKGYKGSSKFKFWQELKEHDILEITLELIAPGRNGKKLYATQLKVKKLDTGEVIWGSLSEITNYFSKLDYKQGITSYLRT